jgi:hypothetical protein
MFLADACNDGHDHDLGGCDAEEPEEKGRRLPARMGRRTRRLGRTPAR